MCSVFVWRHTAGRNSTQAHSVRASLPQGGPCNGGTQLRLNPIHSSLPQGGAEEALSLSDSTGSTPSQLAIEKGHRLLGLHLAEYKMRQVRRRGSFFVGVGFRSAGVPECAATGLVGQMLAEYKMRQVRRRRSNRCGQLM